MSQTLMRERLAQPAQMPGFSVSFTQKNMAERAADMRSKMNSRLISLAVSIVLTIVFYFIWKPKSDELFFWILIAGLCYSMVMALVSVMKMARARSVSKSIIPGPAFLLDNEGVAFPSGEKIRFSSIKLVKAVDKRFNPGPNLVFEWQDGRRSFPIIFLDANPEIIDGILRANSRGRFGMDLSQVDEVW